MHAQLTRHLHKLSVEIGCRPIGLSLIHISEPTRPY